jgi:hypothetical protein
VRAVGELGQYYFNSIHPSFSFYRIPPRLRFECGAGSASCASALSHHRPTGAGALQPPWSPQCASAQHLRFPPLSPFPPSLLSPSRSRLRGALTPERRPEAALGRSPLHSREIMYHPSRGAARRLGPCLRAYQARPQVRAKKGEERGGGERPSSEPVRGAGRAGFCAGAVAPTAPSNLFPVARGGTRGRRAGKAALWNCCGGTWVLPRLRTCTPRRGRDSGARPLCALFAVTCAWR